MEKKEQGNEFFKIHEYEKAKAMYYEAIEEIEQKVEYASLLFSLYSNISICQLKLGEYEKCVEICNNLLDQEPKNIKALLRRAKSFEILKLYNQSLEDLQTVLKIQPNNKNAKDDIKKITTLKVNSYKNLSKSSESNDIVEILPLDAIIEIISFLPIESVNSTARVSHNWKAILSYSSVWRNFYQHIKTQFHTNEYFKFVRIYYIALKILETYYDRKKNLLNGVEKEGVNFMIFIDQTPKLKEKLDLEFIDIVNINQDYGLYLIDQKFNELTCFEIRDILISHDYEELKLRKALNKKPILEKFSSKKMYEVWAVFSISEIFSMLLSRKMVPVFEILHKVLNDEMLFRLALKYYEYGKTIIENDELFLRLSLFRKDYIQKIYKQDSNLAKLIYEKRNIIF